MPETITLRDIAEVRGDGQLWALLYVEHDLSETRRPVSDNTSMIFCKLYDPEASTLTFIGHILIDGDRRCFNLFSEIADLAALSTGTKFNLYLEMGELSVKEITNPFESLDGVSDLPVEEIKTISFLEWIGLWFGHRDPSQRGRGGGIRGDRTKRALPHLCRGSGSIRRWRRDRGLCAGTDSRGVPISVRCTRAVLVSQTSEEEEDDDANLCVVCLFQPRTAGFVHGTSYALSCPLLISISCLQDASLCM